MAYNEGLAERIRATLKRKPGVVEKKMFGGVGFLINGNMACGVNKQDLVLRLNEAEFEDAMKQPNVRIFNMTGKPMKGWILISPDGYKSEEALSGWIDKGITFAKSLPHK